MRIPTVIVINDHNEELSKLTEEMMKLVRVYKRNSLQGEQLYGIREGVMYFDDKGDKQFIHQDIYSETLKQLQTKLKLVAEPAKQLLQRYLNPNNDK